MPVDDARVTASPGLSASTCQVLRRVEADYLRDGEVTALDRIDALLDGYGGDLVDATRWQVSLLRADRAGEGGAVDGCIATVGRVVDRHPAYRLVLAAALTRRCDRDGDLGDLDRAIDLRREVTVEEHRDASPPLWIGPTWRSIELGTALLERFRLRGKAADLTAAAEIMGRAPERRDAPAVRAVRLGRLAACDHEEYGLTGRRSALQRAVRRYRGAIDGLGDGAPARPLLLTELGTALQDRYEDSERPADLREALRLAELAVATEPGTGADLACHLVNLGNALEMVHAENVEDHQPLLAAVDCWRRALSHLPARSPYRGAFLDRLALGLIGCVHLGLADPGTLEEAVMAARAAVREGASSAQAAVFANNLADALTTRWETHREIGDLHEAIDVLRSAVAAVSPRTATGPYLIMNLVQSRISRYAAVGDPADLERAIAELDRLADVPSSPGQRGWWHGARAHLELMRYAREGRRTQLDAAVVHARRSRILAPPGSGEHVVRSGYLASGLHWRYLLTGRRRDLDAAITAMRGRHDERATNPDRLASFLQERHERYGDPADGLAAMRWAELAAEDADGQPSPPDSHGLAMVLHGRFEIAGRHADLDEAVQRHRKALAGMHPGAPSGPWS